MVESLPTMVDKHIKEQVEKHSFSEQQYQLYISMKADPQLQQQDIAIWLDDPHDNAHPGGESAKRQKTSEYEAHVTGESSGQVNEKEQGDEHQYHIDQMKNFLKSDIRDPEAPALSLINQDLLYLKKGSLGPEKISKNGLPDRKKEPGKPNEVVYSNLNIIQVIKTYWELGHEHKFITEIVARRANECIVSITKPDYKNLNKNDIEDMYLLIMNSKNSKKEKRVMRHSKIHKFCDATLNRVLEGLKSYNNDVKYGYIQRDLTEDKVEYLKLFEKEIEVRLKYRNQMKRWEMYVNRRPLGP
ncbi:hypothetical protein Tco_1549063 [Tanacetum coccineum]